MLCICTFVLGLANLLLAQTTGYYIEAKDFWKFSSNFSDNVNITQNACYQGKYLSDYFSGLKVHANITGFTGALSPMPPLSWEMVMRHPFEWFKDGKWETLSE